MNIEEPVYKNNEVLIFCMKREPHSLIFDRDFAEYDEKTVLELCEDLETQFEYISKVGENDQKFIDMMTWAQSLVWAGLFHHHNDIVPEK